MSPTPLAALAAVMIASTTALATPHFQIGAVDASDGIVINGVPGTGIDVTGGTIYQSPWAAPSATSEPNLGLGITNPNYYFDSYLTIDSAPVSSTPGYDGTDVPQADEVPGSPGFTDTNYRGVWFVSGPFVRAFEAVKDGQDVRQLFLGRITHTGALSGRLATQISQLVDGGDPHNQDDYFDPVTIVGDIVTIDELNSGQGWITHDTDGEPLVSLQSSDAVYAFVRKEFEVEIESVMHTVSDLYLQSLVPVPSPGGAACCTVLIGATALRRRRLA